MQKKRNVFLSDYVVKQYPISDFKKIIFITLDIVENFLLSLENGFDYNSLTIASYSEKYASFQKNKNSKIETIYLQNIDTNDKMQEFLKSYFNAYESLNDDEKIIFNASFIDRLSDLEIIYKYKTHSRYISMVRNSAIIRFCIKSGLDKFVDLV